MANAYWFEPNRVDEAIDALQDLGFKQDKEKFHEFVKRYKKATRIVYRVYGGLTYSSGTLENSEKVNTDDIYIDLLEPKEPIFTEEYKESQDSFAELCNPTEYPF